MVIIHIVEPFAAGVAVFIKLLTESIQDDKHIIIHGERKSVLSAEEVKKTFKNKNVYFIRWKSIQRSIHPVKDLVAFIEIYKILRRLKRKNLISAVHLHSSKSGLLGRLACFMANIKNVIYTPNGAPFLSGKNKLTNLIYQQLEIFGNKLCGTVICCSASEYASYKKLGIRAYYINNGTSLDLKRTYTKSKKKNKKFSIITSGRIVDQKNPVLFNKIAAYFEEFDQFEFVWVGDGEERSKLTAKNIKITGWLQPHLVNELVSKADLYISTSLYEGLSFAVLDALALQKPVLLSNCIGNMDIIKSGLNGDIFENESDAIIKVLNYYNNREMMKIMGDYSLDICKEDFNMKSNFLHYQDFYKNPNNATKRYGCESVK